MLPGAPAQAAPVQSSPTPATTPPSAATKASGASAPATPVSGAPAAPAQPVVAQPAAGSPPPAAAPEASPAAQPVEGIPAETAPNATAPAGAEAAQAGGAEEGHASERGQLLSARVRTGPIGGWYDRRWIGLPSQKHTGFSIRLAAGIGFGRADRDISGDAAVSGFNAAIGLDVGASVMENLIVYGRIGGFAFNHASSGDAAGAGSAYFGMLGAGARYHFMPFDWYVGGTLALAAVTVTNALNDAQNANPGFGFELETGKYWWLDYRDKRAYGVGLRFGYVRSGSLSRGRERDEPWIGTAISAVFSTSYN